MIIISCRCERFGRPGGGRSGLGALEMAIAPRVRKSRWGRSSAPLFRLVRQASQRRRMVAATAMATGCKAAWRPRTIPALKLTSRCNAGRWTDAMCALGCATEDVSLLLRPLDFRPERRELGLDGLISPVQVIDAGDFGNAVGGEAG